MPQWVILSSALLYAAILFAVAWTVERRPAALTRFPPGFVYALSIAVYCTSWTFFGAVGTAASDGWDFLPIYLGPVIVFLFGRSFLERLVAAVQRENMGSISEFIATRYARSRAVAALVTILATLGALPYVALQLKALGATVAQLSLVGGDESSEITVFILAAMLVVFSIMFGARRYDATARNRGLVAAIALESIIKLAALVLVGAFAMTVLAGLDPGLRAAGDARLAAVFAVDQIDVRFVTITLLSMVAIVCLPRQFYVGIVECRDPAHVRTAQKLVPLYMALTCMVVAPITLAGLSVLPASAQPDLYVLDLPLAHGAYWLALIVFIGGFSAATGMVIAESVALSAMISNDLFAPLLLRSGGVGAERDVGRLMLAARRLSIAGIILLGYLYYQAIDSSETLAEIGLVSFAAVAQFAPALLGALYWRRAARPGAKLGLAVGLAVWAWTLFLPAYLGDAGMEASELRRTFGGLLDPLAMFGIPWSDHLSHGVFWSLGFNTLAYVLGCRYLKPGVGDRLLSGATLPRALVGGIGPAATAGDLMALAERFVGAGAVETAFAGHAARRGQALSPDAPIDMEFAREAERLIARVIGASSARVIVGSALRRGSLDVAAVVGLLDETSQELSFSRELLAATLNNISQGVSVVDKDMRLVAWNARYVEIFDFPAGFLQVGRPISDVIRYNALNGECGPGEVEAHVARRLANMRRRSPHTYERIRPNGMVLKTIGNPMPGGGYVTSFTDITVERRAQEALQAANEGLEARVVERTTELVKAKQAADEATLGKTKFLAAASHDLLQPLNAARLFTAVLQEKLKEAGEVERLAGSVERSIAAADRLLRALLDISKLDAGGVEAKPSVFPVSELLEELVDQFMPLASEKGLSLRCAPCSAHVASDRTLLRSVVQNYLSNAVRYTARGGILLGCRRRGDRLLIEVWDTGSGIPEDKRRAIFEEFRRLHAGDHAEGVGLGLAIVERTARILGASIDLRSEVGRGSVFSVDAPLSQGPATVRPAPSGLEGSSGAGLSGLRVLCLDNEPKILEGLAMLLGAWGCRVRTAAGVAEALDVASCETFDAALIDYHLGEEKTGLDAVRAFASAPGAAPKLALVTADAAPELAAAAERIGATVIPKPVDPALLRAFLSEAAIRRQALQLHPGEG